MMDIHHCFGLIVIIGSVSFFIGAIAAAAIMASYQGDE